MTLWTSHRMTDIGFCFNFLILIDEYLMINILAHSCISLQVSIEFLLFEFILLNGLFYFAL